MELHSKLSASGSKKWLNCPLSLELESRFEDSESSYAKLGTTAHSLGELKIKRELNIISRNDYYTTKDEILESVDISEIEDLELYTDEYRDFVIERYNKALSKNKNAEILIEQRLDYSEYAKDGFGTGDIVIYDYSDIEIIDLKYGKGVKVDAFENSQLMLYGLGAIGLYDLISDINNIKMTIFQPRLDNISSYETTYDELVKWGNEVVKPKSDLALSGKGQALYGSHCDDGFCKARPRCKAYNYIHTKIQKYNKKHPELLSDEELLDVYEVTSTFDKWVKSVNSYMLAEMLRGKVYKGLKLVEGRTSRKYTDETEIKNILVNNGFNQELYLDVKLKSISKLEKSLGSEKFNNLIGKFVYRPKGVPTIVNVEDKRPEYNSAELDFADINL